MGKYSGMADCLAKTAKEGGVLSLYNALFVSSIGIVVYRGVQFGLQDIIKAFNPYQYDVSMIGIVSKFIVAQIAVSVSGIAAYPFDTMQRRLKIEGAGGFFKGAFANILRGTGAAITLVLYDEF